MRLRQPVQGNCVLQVLYVMGIGEFLPNRLTAPLLSTLCSGWPLDEVCAAAVAYFFFGPSSTIKPQDYKGENNQASLQHQFARQLHQFALQCIVFGRQRPSKAAKGCQRRQ